MKYAAICGLLAFAGAASAQTILYDTFNEADQTNLFDCCSSLPIGGDGKDKVSVSLPFTVPAKTKITEIDIPLFFVSGSRNEAKVMLLGERKKKHYFRVFHMGAGGQCCAFMALDAQGIAVAPGTTYNLVVRGIHSLDGWNLNSVGVTGDYTTKDQNGEHQQNGTLPAMRIIGR